LLRRTARRGGSATIENGGTVSACDAGWLAGDAGVAVNRSAWTENRCSIPEHQPRSEYETAPGKANQKSLLALSEEKLVRLSDFNKTFYLPTIAMPAASA